MPLLTKLVQNIFTNLKKRLFFSVFFLLIGIQHPQVVAQEKSIYELEISVREEEGVDQNKLIRQAIEEVLVRVGGSDKVLGLDLVKEALSSPDKYVRQLSYHQRAAERSIKILFNENLINQLLVKVKQSAWQKERPLLLVWLMKEQEWTSMPEMAQVLTKRAIPFVFPLLDLVDMIQVSEADVCNGVLESLSIGAKRYNPDVILLGRLQNRTNRWQGNWTILKENSENVTWTNEAQNLNVLLNETAEELVLKLRGTSINVGENDNIAADDAAKKAIMRQLSLSVVGILNMEQYTKVLEYLRQLPTVVEVEVSQIMPEKTVFDLRTTANKDMIVKSINEGNLLIEDLSILNGNFEEVLFYKVAGTS